jgi:Leucine-rich repeat (LRR) protein
MYYMTFDYTRVELNNVDDIYNIPNPTNVYILNLSNNQLTTLDKNIFKNLTHLQELHLNANNLSHLDKNIFKNLTHLKELHLNANKLTTLDKDSFKHLTQLRELHLNANKLTHLYKDIFKNLTNLQYLNLSDNKLTHLDKDIFKHLTNLQNLSLRNINITHLDKDTFIHLTNLQVLILYNNKLNTLDKDIFINITNLQQLHLDNNKLTTLNKDIFKYTTNLQNLYLHSNYLTHLDNDIFKHLINLQLLWLHINYIVALPSSITHCRQLNEIYYSDNEINYIPPNIQRFLNNLKQTSKKLQIYNDSQNVHNHHIQECIKTSLENILNYPKTIDKNVLINALLNSKMNDRSLRLLLEYCQDESVHSVLNITFEEALLHILEYINLELKDNRNDILNILETEILDSECKCFTGRISRLINCLNGYTPLVKVEIPDNMAISNIIIMIKNSYKGDNVDELKELVKTALLERGYALDTITEYLEYIDI